jgi:hypothetical protein
MMRIRIDEGLNFGLGYCFKAIKLLYLLLICSKEHIIKQIISNASVLNLKYWLFFYNLDRKHERDAIHVLSIRTHDKRIIKDDNIQISTNIIWLMWNKTSLREGNSYVLCKSLIYEIIYSITFSVATNVAGETAGKGTIFM